jgi:hypothetical protein
MDLQAIVSVAEIVNALAVTLTLVVLVISIRQNTNSQRAVAVDALAAAVAAINVPAMESPIIGSAVSRATADWGAAAREERIIAHYYLFSYFKLCENAWYQYRARILDHTQWLGWEKPLRMYYHCKGVQEGWWPMRRHSYSLDFQQFLSATTRPTDIASLTEMFDYVSVTPNSSLEPTRTAGENGN